MSKSVHRYIGTKEVLAEPMTRRDYLKKVKHPVPQGKPVYGAGEEEGYVVQYLDGGKPNHPDIYPMYVSWSPKDVFERAYKLKTDVEASKTANIGGNMPRHVFSNLVNDLRAIPAVGSKREIIVKILGEYNIKPTPVEQEPNLTPTMSFGEAINLVMKENKRIARAGWNGKGQYVFLISNDDRKFAPQDEKGTVYDVAPTMGLKNAQSVVYMGWVPSVGDLFATDWIVIE